MDGQIGSVPLGPQWDPVADKREDTEWVEQRWQDPSSRVVLIREGQIAVGADEHPEWLPTTAAPDERICWALLGIDADGCARFAVAVPADPASVLAEDPTATGSAAWLPLRELPRDDAAELFGAVALANWHGSHGYCPRCGTATEQLAAGWQRRCPTDGTRHFPRVDPAVIMLVHDGGDRALLGRRKRWPTGWFSTLAGFVEPGETLAAAVAREVAEEVGLQVLDVEHLGSQPWPFPNSLMIGFHARVDFTEPQPDGDEIEEAVWVTRDELAAASAAGDIRLPPALSISRWLIQQWYGAELPGEWSRS